MASRDAEDSECLREIRLDPVGELRRGLSVSRDDILEPPLSLGQGLGSCRTRGCLPGPDPTLNPHIDWYRKSKPVTWAIAFCMT